METDTNEPQRVQAVKDYLSLNFSKSKEFQDVVDIAAQICNTPVAVITLLDDQYSWLTVRKGVDVEKSARETSFCQYCITNDDVMIIPDVSCDERFANNPFVHGSPGVRFYACAPLILKNGIHLGSLGIYDHEPGQLTDLQQKMLMMLARHTVYMLELEMNQRILHHQIEEIKVKNDSLHKIAHMQSHEIRQPLTSIMGLINIVNNKYQDVDEEWLKMMEEAANALDARIKSIVNETTSSKDLKLIRLHRMVEEIEDYSIITLDKDGNIENWNRGAEQLQGYTGREITGKHFEIFYTQRDRKNTRPQQLIAEATEKGVARDEGWRIRKNGSMFWGSILITAIHNDDGEVIGFTKVTRDLTDLKETQQSLVASEQRYLRMINEVKDYAIILLNAEGEIENWNAGAERITKYMAHEIIGQHLSIFYTPEDKLSEIPKNLLSTARSDGRARHEGWRVRKDGSRFWGSITITALHDSQGEVIGFSKVTRDLTDKKLAKDAQLDYVKQLETRNQQMEHLAHDTSHALQGLFTTFAGFLDTFEAKYKPIVDVDGMAYIHNLNDSLSRISTMIKEGSTTTPLIHNQPVQESNKQNREKT